MTMIIWVKGSLLVAGRITEGFKKAVAFDVGFRKRGGFGQGRARVGMGPRGHRGKRRA